MGTPLSFIRPAALLLACASMAGCASSAGVRSESALDRMHGSHTEEILPDAPPIGTAPETTLDRMRRGYARDVVVFYARTPAFMSGAPGPLLRVDPPTESLLGLR